MSEANGQPTYEDVERQLARLVTVHFDCNSLGSAIEYVRETTGANFRVQWPSLELRGISQDTLISLNLRSVTAAHLLHAVLELASFELVSEKAGFTIHHGMVVIDMVENLRSCTEVLNYPLAPILEKASVDVEADSIVFPPFSQCAAMLNRIRDIVSSVMNDKPYWDSEYSSLTLVGTELHVQATWEGHREVRGLLNGLFNQIPDGHIATFGPVRMKVEDEGLFFEGTEDEESAKASQESPAEISSLKPQPKTEKKKRGRPRVYDKDDAINLRRDYEASGLSMKEFADARNLPRVAVIRELDRGLKYIQEDEKKIGH